MMQWKTYGRQAWASLILISAGFGLGCSSSSTSDDVAPLDASIGDSDKTTDAKEKDQGADEQVDAGSVDSGIDSGVDSGLDVAAPDDGSVGDVDAEPEEAITCPQGSTEVFRDDFDGTEVDSSKWDIIDQGIGGGTFTQKTYMRRENVRVEGGHLVVSSWRHCENPRSNRSTPVHPEQCPGSEGNFYSGAWLKSKNGYAAGGKGSMIFRAKMPSPVRGYFPALWARNMEGGDLYTELDLIEMSWDRPKNVEADPDTFTVTTHFGTGAKYHAQGPALGPFNGLTDSFHVWEVQWDAHVTPAVVRYYYRDTALAESKFLRETTVASSGFVGNVTEKDFVEGLQKAFRPYVDYAVLPDTKWSVSPDTAEVYNPDEVLVDSVIVCQY